MLWFQNNNIFKLVFINYLMKRRGKLFLFLFIFLILSVSFASAGFFSNTWDKITGHSVSGCSDSDGGWDYFNYGYVIDSKNYIYPDSCYTASKVKEWACGEDGLGSYELYDCPNGCSEGACEEDIGGSNETNNSCTPDWQCNDWTDCVNGQQTRTCTDNNSCGVTTGKPVESQSCTSGSTTNLNDFLLLYDDEGAISSNKDVLNYGKTILDNKDISNNNVESFDLNTDSAEAKTFTTTVYLRENNILITYSDNANWPEYETEAQELKRLISNYISQNPFSEYKLCANLVPAPSTGFSGTQRHYRLKLSQCSSWIESTGQCQTSEDCASGFVCANNICMSEGNCNDTDGGKKYYVRGITSSTSPIQTPSLIPDTQIDSRKISETYCKEDKTIGIEEYRCPEGAKEDGTCLPIYECKETDNGGRDFENYGVAISIGYDEERNVLENTSLGDECHTDSWNTSQGIQTVVSIKESYCNIYGNVNSWLGSPPCVNNNCVNGICVEGFIEETSFREEPEDMPKGVMDWLKCLFSEKC